MVYWIREVLEILHVPDQYISQAQAVFTFTAILTPLPVLYAFYKWSRPRQSVVPPYRERVLILGASSGVGKELALAYAGRGCRNIVLVGRRQAELDLVVSECIEKKRKGEEWEQSQEAPGWEKESPADDPDVKQTPEGIFALRFDCSVPEDLIQIREACRKAFGGIDTLHICFGVSALRPLLGIAGIDPIRSTARAELLPNLTPQSSKIEADVNGLLVVQEAHQQINNVNVVATSLVLTTFLPMLQTTSLAPSINLLSSISAYIPAPTRPLYGSSKAAQLICFQSVGIEAASQAASSTASPKRAKVTFHATLPGTILSDFRKSAVDGSVESSGAIDDSWKGKGKGDGLTTSHVAAKCIHAVDRYLEGVEELPAKYWLARRLLPTLPSVMAKMAQKKYGY
ncbi:hypothetical protein CBS101457_005898 [Exobasidium rhododendri]|nr:hypothetical protein CBS101457_005898 [Exobasidium rhododendri]